VPVDALVLEQIARVLRLRMPREVRGRADHGHPDVAGHGHGDHVAVDHLAELDPGVVPLGDDVTGRVAHVEVEPDVRMRRQEISEQRAAAHEVDRASYVQSERAPRDVAQLPDVGDGRTYLLQRRPHRRIEPLPGLREPHAARGPLQQDDAQLPLELAQRLAHRRGAHPEPLPRGAKTAHVGHGHEHRHRIQVFCHCEAMLQGSCVAVK
jgi:hypothetical protein